MNSSWRVGRARLLLAIFVGVVSRVAFASPAGFLEPAQAFRGQVRVPGTDAVEVRFDVAPGYYLYRDRISIVPHETDAVLGPVDLPAGQSGIDGASQKKVEILEGAVLIRVPVKTAGSDFRLRINYQGCADKGLCYLPQTAFAAVAVDDGKVVRASWQDDEALPSAAVAQAGETAHIASALESGDLPTIAGVFLVAGLLLAFTPCVLPMVPILSSIIVGQGAPVSRTRGFVLALTYSQGMALVYTCFGVAAGLLGEGLAAAMQNAWVLGAFALLLAALSLSMFGFFELQMPGFVRDRAARASDKLPGGKLIGVFAMGGLSALIVGPCVAAPLAGALVFISQTRDVLVGGLALFSLAMGMSVPLLLVGVSAGSLLPRTGAWMVGIKTFFGVVLLAVALWIVSPVLPAHVLMISIGAALLVGAASLKLFDRLADAAPHRQRVAKGIALVLAVLGTLQLVGALSGGTDPLQPLGHLARAGDGARSSAAKGIEFRRVLSSAEFDAAVKAADRPVLLDFYADWCVSCKEMEHLTFNDPAVRARLANAVLLQADVTANSPDDKALLKRFNLFGPPGILFFNAQGQEHAGARVIGFVPPERFAASLALAGL